MHLSKNGQGILKILHFLTISFWMGGSLGLALLLYAATNAQTGDELFGILKSYRFISVILTVYLGAYGVFFTGLAYSLLTNRGFFRHKWVVIKWVITLGMIVFGAFVLEPWATSMLEMTASSGLEAMHSPHFRFIYQRHLACVVAYMALFIVATALSVYKPWEKAELAARQLAGSRREKGRARARQAD